jgi:prepilin-type N-terminal cleavage/methylation domain-containing protein
LEIVMRKTSVSNRRGFTLVETVVTVGIVAALAAVVYPTVVKQFDNADPARAAEDLNSIRTGIDMFGVNVRPNQPQELEDLVNPIQVNTAGDSSALGAVYSATDALAWNGPYIGISVPATSLRNAPVINTAFGGTINNRLPLYDIDVGTTGGDTTDTSPTTNADFVSVMVAGLSGAAFNAINSLIDGPSENTAILRRHTGRFRCPGAAAPADTDVCGAAYYLATPLRQ